MKTIKNEEMSALFGIPEEFLDEKAANSRLAKFICASLNNLDENTNRLSKAIQKELERCSREISDTGSLGDRKV